MTVGHVVGGESGRSPVVAAVLSAVVPGAGQWYAGRRLRSLIYFVPILLVLVGVGAGAATGSLGLRSLLGWVVQPTLLRVSLVANVAVLGWRIAAVVDAYVVAGGRRPSPGFAVLLLAVLAGVVAAPQVAVASYTVRSIALIEAVFVVEEEPIQEVLSVEMIREPAPPEKRPEPTEPVEFESSRSTRNLVFRPGIGDPEAVEVWVDIVAPPTVEAPLPPYRERVAGDRLTVLLVGADEGPGRKGLRTDTMIVASFDIESGEAALFGLPRNFKRVPLPSEFRNSFIKLEKEAIEKEEVDNDGDGFPDTWVDRNGDGIPDKPRFKSCRCFPEMLNRVHENTMDWTKTYPDTPDPGLAALRDIIAHLIDLRIDYYVMVNMEGFVDVVDAIGGVEVMVEEPYHVAVSAPSEGSPKARVNVEPGLNHLTGLEALAYSRWRIGSSDYDRMQRQRCLIRAAADQLDPLTLARSFHTLADVVERSVVTDIPVTFLPDLVEILGGVNLEQVSTIGLVPPTYNRGRTPGGYPIPNVDRIRAKVAEVLEGTATEADGAGTNECGM